MHPRTPLAKEYYLAPNTPPSASLILFFEEVSPVVFSPHVYSGPKNTGQSGQRLLREVVLEITSVTVTLNLNSQLTLESRNTKSDALREIKETEN